MLYDTQTADARLTAVMTVINGWAGTKTVESLAREVLAAADEADPRRTMEPLLRRLNAQRKLLK